MSDALAGKRILIVEDEYFIAADLKRLLSKEQAIVIGPVGGLDEGLSLAEGEPLDAAILDVNLENAFSYAIADRLTARTVPYLFLTGYDVWALPARYREAPRVTKPFPGYMVVSTVERLCATAEVA